MKRTTLLLALSVILTPLFISCIEKQEKIETMVSGFMTGQTDSEGYVKTLKDDYGKKYTISEKSEKLEPDSRYRLVASLALDEDLNARILQMAPAISYRAYEDSINPDFNDPVEIHSRYIGGGYLNIYLGVKVSKEDAAHDVFYSRVSTPGKLEFTIYHNAYGDEPVYTKHAYISIPLYGYGLSKNDTVFLSAKGYKEDYDYELIYK